MDQVLTIQYREGMRGDQAVAFRASLCLLGREGCEAWGSGIGDSGVLAESKRTPGRSQDEGVEQYSNPG